MEDRDTETDRCRSESRKWQSKWKLLKREKQAR